MSCSNRRGSTRITSRHVLFLFWLLLSPHLSVHCLQPQCAGRLGVEVDADCVFWLAIVVSTVTLTRTPVRKPRLGSALLLISPSALSSPPCIHTNTQASDTSAGAVLNLNTCLSYRFTDANDGETWMQQLLKCPPRIINDLISVGGGVIQS